MRDFRCNLQCPSYGYGSLTFEHLGDGLPLYEFHDDVTGVTKLSGVVHMDDVGVAQFGRGSGLLNKVLHFSRIAGEIPSQHFDGHKTVE